jgi:hypothetical protein
MFGQVLKDLLAQMRINQESSQERAHDCLSRDPGYSKMGGRLDGELH